MSTPLAPLDDTCSLVVGIEFKPILTRLSKYLLPGASTLTAFHPEI